MPPDWIVSPPGLETERRLTKAEVRLRGHARRLAVLERWQTWIVWALAALAVGKSSDLADILITVLSRRL